VQPASTLATHAPTLPSPAQDSDRRPLEPTGESAARATARSIGAAAFEARSVRARSAPRTGQPSAASSRLPPASVPRLHAGLVLALRSPAPPPERRKVLPATLRASVSRYEVKAGAIISAVLVTSVRRHRSDDRAVARGRSDSPAVLGRGLGPPGVADWVLQAWRRRTQNGPAGGPTTS